jgi:hypothetical protein
MVRQPHENNILSKLRILSTYFRAACEAGPLPFGRGMQAGRIKVERSTPLVGPELRSCRLQRRIFDVAISLTLLIGYRRHACTESNFSHSISRRPTSTSLVNSRTMAPLYHGTLALEYLQCLEKASGLGIDRWNVVEQQWRNIAHQTRQGSESKPTFPQLEYRRAHVPLAQILDTQAASGVKAPMVLKRPSSGRLQNQSWLS